MPHYGLVSLLVSVGVFLGPFRVSRFGLCIALLGLHQAVQEAVNPVRERAAHAIGDVPVWGSEIRIWG